EIVVDPNRRRHATIFKALQRGPEGSPQGSRLPLGRGPSDSAGGPGRKVKTVRQPIRERHCSSLHFEVGLRYNGDALVPSAQTERRGGAGPVSVLLRGW